MLQTAKLGDQRILRNSKKPPALGQRVSNRDGKITRERCNHSRCMSSCSSCRAAPTRFFLPNRSPVFRALMYVLTASLISLVPSCFIKASKFVSGSSLTSPTLI